MPWRLPAVGCLQARLGIEGCRMASGCCSAVSRGLAGRCHKRDLQATLLQKKLQRSRFRLFCTGVHACTTPLPLPALSHVPQKQALCNHLPGLQPLLEAMPPAKSRAQQVRSQPEFARLHFDC